MIARAREMAANLALSAAVVTVLLSAAEAWCRWRERGQPASREVASYIQDWQDWHGDFYTVKSVAVGSPPWEDYNHEGLRDREHAAEKPAGVRRLVCLGDSTTLGWGLRPEEAYPQVLQDLLDGEGGRWEVLSVALPGWSTRQEAIAYRRIARAYAPDLVLLGVCLNDIPELQNNLTRPPAWLAALHRRSALVRRAVGAREREIADVDELFTRPDAPAVREAYGRLFGEIRALRDDVSADGARLAVLMFPFAEQVQPSAPPPLPQQTIARFCRAERIPTLDLQPALAGLGANGFLDYDHFSASGALAVAEALVESGLVTSAAGEEGVRSRAPAAPVGPRAMADVVRGLEAADGATRLAAVRALATMGDDARGVAAEVARRLDDPDARVRVAATWAVGALAAPDSAVPVLIRDLHDADPRARAGAAWALGRFGGRGRQAEADLVDRLEDEDESVRWRAGIALSRMDANPVLVPRLGLLVASPASRGRGPAAEVLGRIGPLAAPAVPALVAALSDRRQDVRWHAVWALGRIGPAASAAVPALLPLMAEASLRWRVVDALGAIGPAAAAAVPFLQAALDDDSESVRWRAAQALGGIGPAAQAAAPMLAGRLRDDSANVRLAAVHSLGDVGAEPADTLPGLVHALDDPDRRVRHEGANVLGRLGGRARAAVPVLILRLADEDGGVRAGAARALGRIGGVGAPGQRALQALRADPDERVRDEAERALRVLRSR